MIRKVSSSQPTYFIMGMIIFVIAALAGWVKLHYGFNFIDEGYHMVESWRLSAGDHLFRDRLTDVLLLYTLINAQIFGMFPDITLLGFREIQYALAILSMAALGASVFSVTKQYWYLPLVFSVFAFTGLDPTGMISNLNYYTYPHFFLTLHISTFLMGLNSGSVVRKRSLFVLSGLCLWGIGLSLLHLSVVAASPVIVYVVLRFSRQRPFSFSLSDLCFTLAPFVFCWLAFLGIHNRAYVASVIASTRFFAEHHWTMTSLNWEAMKHIVVTGIYAGIVYSSFRMLRARYFIPVLAGMSACMYLVIDSSLFGLITPYYNGWFSCQMWFSSLLFVLMVSLWVLVGRKIIAGLPWGLGYGCAFVILVPCTIQFIFSSILSTNGILTILHVSIPLTVAAVVLLSDGERMQAKPYLFGFAALFLFLCPFYYTTAWADWRFTYFDVAPDQADRKIERGFGRGIVTNPIYLRLYDWIENTSRVYTKEGDFILSYVNSPMVYMVAKRRPALDHSFTDFTSRPEEYFARSVEKMVESGRYPKMAYVFDRISALSPESLKANRYELFASQFDLLPDNPISRYVSRNMSPAGKIQLAEGFEVKCFVDNAELLAVLLKKDPRNPDLSSRLGNVLQKRGQLDGAIESYRKALDSDPNSVRVLHNLAIVYALKGDDASALGLFRRVIALNPKQVDAYYNISCIYARQKKIDDAIAWLEKAVQKGFDDRELMEKDKDLRNIRGTIYYRQLLERIDRAD